ncbi:hypothetical protein F5X97DRAFT_318622 [Nemania serpens]|nr:hypothetical protein F5X97DRAFT_318622 [Nemania serpens]
MPTKPRILHILNQVPLSRAERSRNERMRQRGQQAKDRHQQVREGVTIEVPVHDLKPLQVLNAYRRDLGLGPSRNLISSSLFDYDPNAIAEYYERVALSDASRSSSARSSTQRQIETNPFGLPGLPILSLASDYNGQEPEYREGNDGSIPHIRSYDGDDKTRLERGTAAAGRKHRVQK